MPEALEADLSRVYGRDLLAQMWRGEVTPRYVAVRAVRLPPGSAVWVELGTDSAWTTGDHLTALVVDALVGGNWQRGNGQGSKPKPLPRPADIKKQQQAHERMAARAARFLEKTGGSA